MELYENKGFSQADADRVIRVMSKDKYRDFFIDHMMALELGTSYACMCWLPASASIVMSLSGFVGLLLYLLALQLVARALHPAGMEVPDADDNPWKAGLAMFIAFLIFGSLPLWPYVGFYVSGYENHGSQFGICCATTVLALFLLGILQVRTLVCP